MTYGKSNPSIAVMIAKKMKPPEKKRPMQNDGDDEPSEAMESDDGAEGEYAEGGEAAMEEFMEAVKSGNSSAAWMAFKSLVDMC